MSLDGVEIENVARFVANIAAKSKGAAIRLSVRRAGRERRLTATLGARPTQFAAQPKQDGPLLQLDTGRHKGKRDVPDKAFGA